MSKIHLLDQQLINKIAAGEVVERPASVVKELVENSIDAGATRIEIDIENGGLDLIRVSDNGSGMTEDDAKMSLQRHATSKISDINDLHRIMTMGFRGEALAAISSVSQFRLTTKTADSDAVEVSYEEGAICSKPAAGVQGTVIEVRGLFYSVPARKKFMKSGSTEFRHILQTVSDQAMLTPTIAWKLSHNGKTMLDLPSVADWKDRIIAIVGKELTEQMIPLRHQRASLIIDGFLLHPAKAREGLKEQHLFVNKRPVNDYLIAKAVKEGFHNHIAHHFRPGFVLQISLAPDLVDVNVHPRKSEVKFADPSGIFREVLFAVKQALPGSAGTAVSSGGRLFSAPSGSGMRAAHRPSSSEIKQSMDIQSTFFASRPSSSGQPASSPSYFSSAAQMSDELAERGWRLIGQLHNSYLLVETPDGLTMVDQHAVAEKVLFEELLANLSAPKVQALLVPLVLELTAQQHSLAEEYLDLLHSMGIEAEPFGGNSLRVSGLPQNVRSNEVKSFILDVLSDMQDETFRKAPSMQKRQEELAKIASCRGAVKFGEPLKWEEQVQLLKDLLRFQITACCHGRPVMFQIAKEQMAREVGRP